MVEIRSGETRQRYITSQWINNKHGQVYVAVSRCRTLEGIILATPVRRVDIHTRAIAERFLSAMRKQAPIARTSAGAL